MLPPLFSPIRKVLPLLVVGQDLVLEVFLVIQNITTPFCNGSILAHPDLFSDLNIEYVEYVCVHKADYFLELNKAI